MYRQPKPNNVRSFGAVNRTETSYIEFFIGYRHGLKRKRWTEWLDPDLPEYKALYNHPNHMVTLYYHLHRMMERAVDAAAPKAHYDYLSKINPKPVYAQVAARIDEVLIKALAGELKCF